MKRVLFAFVLVTVALFIAWHFTDSHEASTDGNVAPAGLNEGGRAANAPAPVAPPETNERRPESPAEQLLADSETIEVQEEPGPRPGLVMRTRLVKTDFKYPLLRVVENLERDNITGEQQLRNQFEEVADHLIVTIEPGSDAEFVAALAGVGGEIRRKMHVSNAYLVAFSPVDLGTLDRAKESLARIPSVKLVAEDVVFHGNATQRFPDDPLFGQLYALHNTGQDIYLPLTDQTFPGIEDADIDAVEAWTRATGRDVVVVAVLDGGIDHTHPDLAANIWTNPGKIAGNGIDDDGNGFIDDVHGYSFYNGNGNTMDVKGHGTHVAGTIGAEGDNGIGVVGVCWNVRLMAVQWLGPNGSGPVSDAADATLYAAQMGAKVINHSWGATFDRNATIDFLEQQIAATAAYGTLNVCSAGNDVKDIDEFPQWPAALVLDNLLTVAATDPRDELFIAGDPTYGSNWGKEKVHLGAPGRVILSTVMNGEYDYKSGTSFASPQVAGAAALAMSFAPESTFLEIRQAILESVDPIPALTDKVATGGRLNLNRMLLHLGLRVVSSDPLAGSATAVPPADFTIVMSEPFAEQGLNAAAFTVNGIPADSHTLVDERTIIYHFLSSPVTAQGPQSMALSEGALRRAADMENSRLWSATFFYDLLPLEVTGVAPWDGFSMELPLTAIELTFSEPIAAASLSPQDLKILLVPQCLGRAKGIEVLSVAVTDPSTAVFSIAPILQEGTLTFTLPAGAVTDVYGNPSRAYSGIFEADIIEVPFEAPLHELKLPGSLILQSGKVSANIFGASDIDRFTLSLPSGSVLTVLVKGTGGLRPQVTLRSPGGAALSSASAALADGSALLQAVPAAATGTYSIEVAGVGGTSGCYEVELLMNAVHEAEAFGGASNDTLAGAQDLDASFIALGAGGASRAAVLGDASTVDHFSFALDAGDRVCIALDTLRDVDPEVELLDASGNLLATGIDDTMGVARRIASYQAPSTGTYVARVAPGGHYVLLVLRNAVFDFDGNSRSGSAQDITGWKSVLGSSRPIGTLLMLEHSSNRQQNRLQVLHPRTGARLGATVPLPTSPGAPTDAKAVAFDGKHAWFLVAPRTESGIVHKVHLATGQLVATHTVDNTWCSTIAYCRGEILVGYHSGIGVYSAADFSKLRTMGYSGVPSFTADHREGFLYEVQNAGSLNPGFSKIDPATGKTIEIGIPVGRDIPYSIRNNTVSVLGSRLHVLELSSFYSDIPAAYSVYSKGSYQWLPPIREVSLQSGFTPVAIGGDNATVPTEDWYSILVTADEPVTLRTHTPGLDNSFNPALELYNASGMLVATDDNGAGDGRNALLVHTPTASGTYRVRVLPTMGTGGDYVLTREVGGTPVNSPPVADNQSVTTLRNTARAITLTGSDSDGDNLSYSIVTGPLNGVLSGIPPNITYTPALNHIGPDSFTFRVNDGQADSPVATVEVFSMEESSAQIVAWDDDFSGPSLNSNLSESLHTTTAATVTQTGGQLVLDSGLTGNSRRAGVYTQSDSSGGTTFNGNPLYNFYEHAVSVSFDIASITGTPIASSGSNVFYVSIGQDAGNVLVPAANAMDYGQGILLRKLDTGSGAFWRMVGVSLNNGSATEQFLEISGLPTAVTYTFDRTNASIRMTGATFTSGPSSGTSEASMTFADLSGVAAFTSYSLGFGVYEMGNTAEKTVATLDAFQVTVIPEPSASALLAITRVTYTDDALEITYTRSAAAFASGATFRVEWSDTLAPGSWSDVDVTQTLLADDGTVQTVKATIPLGPEIRARFARVKMTGP